jgi:hypothetical protein
MGYTDSVVHAASKEGVDVDVDADVGDGDGATLPCDVDREPAAPDDSRR